MMRVPRAIARASIMAMAAVLLAGCGGAKSRLASHMRRGQEFLQHGDLAKASIEFRNAMQIDPKDAQARLMTAETAVKQGQVRGVIGLLQSVIEDHPESDAARTLLARLLVAAGDPKRALEVVKPALVRQPNDVSLLAIRSAGEAEQKDLPAARSDADRALSIDPRNEDAIDLRAGLYRQDGDLPAAIRLVSAAAAAQPAVPGFHQVLISLYQASNQTSLVEEQLRALVRLKPEELSYRTQLAGFLVRAKRLDEAEKVLAEAVKALPANDQAKLVQVDFLYRERSKYAAEQVLRQYVAADSGNYALRLALGSLLVSAGDTAKAMIAYQDIADRDGTEASGLIARDRLAAIAVGEKRDADAQRYLAQVLKVSPHDSDALALRGRMSLARGDATGAIADFRTVLRDEPHNAGINDLLAQALVKQGDVALAEEPLRAAMAGAPTNSVLRVQLAQLLFQLKEPDQAIVVLQDAVKAMPVDVSLNDALVRAYIKQSDLASAAKVADDLRKAKPDDAAPYMLAGLVAKADNRLDDAQAQWEKALSLQPHGYDVLVELVHLQAQRGQAAKAISRLQALSAADPKDALAHNLLGEVYLQQRDFKSAQQALGVAIANQPQWWLPYRNLALAKAGTGDLAGAIDAYQSGLKVAPTETMMLSDLGSLYQNVGKVDDALKLYDSWIARDPGSQVAANNLAMLLVSYRSDKASLDRAQALTAGFANATNGNLLDTAGWVLFKRGAYDQALPELQRAAQLMPDSHEIHYHLGMAELRSGQADRARSDLEAALAGSSRFFGAEDARAALATLRNQAG